MPREQAGGLAELARVELEVEGEGALLEACESLPPRRLVEEVPPALVAGPRGLVVQNLPDAAEPAAVREIAKDGGKVGVFERRRGDHRVVQGRRRELRGDPTSLRDAGLRETRPIALDVADADRLDEGAAGELESVDGKVRLVAHPVIYRVAVDHRKLAGIVAAPRLRGDVPEVKVRVPELHGLAGGAGGGRWSNAGRRPVAAGPLTDPLARPAREPGGSRRRRAISVRRPRRCPCRTPRTAP